MCPDMGTQQLNIQLCWLFSHKSEFPSSTGGKLQPLGRNSELLDMVPKYNWNRQPGPETITDSQQTEYLHKCIFQDTKLKCDIGSCGTVLKEGK